MFNSDPSLTQGSVAADDPSPCPLCKSIWSMNTSDPHISCGAKALVFSNGIPNAAVGRATHSWSHRPNIVESPRQMTNHFLYIDKIMLNTTSTTQTLTDRQYGTRLEM
jgi:hypothetical protein